MSLQYHRRLAGAQSSSRPAVVTAAACKARRVLRPVAMAQAGHQAISVPVEAMKVLVKLSVPHKTQFGESLKIVGGSKVLGEWKVDAAPSLTWTTGDVWTWQGEMYPSKTEFKVVVYNTTSKKAVWEGGANRVLEVPSFPGTLTVPCKWGVPEMSVTFEHAPLEVVDPIEAVVAAAVKDSPQLTAAKDSIQAMVVATLLAEPVTEAVVTPATPTPTPVTATAAVTDATAVTDAPATVAGPQAVTAAVTDAAAVFAALDAAAPTASFCGSDEEPYTAACVLAVDEGVSDVLPAPDTPSSPSPPPPSSPPAPLVSHPIVVLAHEGDSEGDGKKSEVDVIEEPVEDTPVTVVPGFKTSGTPLPAPVHGAPGAGHTSAAGGNGVTSSFIEEPVEDPVDEDEIARELEVLKTRAEQGRHNLQAVVAEVSAKTAGEALSSNILPTNDSLKTAFKEAKEAASAKEKEGAGVAAGVSSDSGNGASMDAFVKEGQEAVAAASKGEDVLSSLFRIFFK